MIMLSLFKGEIEVRPKRTMREIVRDVAAEHELTVEDLCGPRRFRRLVIARHQAMREMRDETRPDGSPRYSYPQIGRFFGGRDHTAAYYACHGGRGKLAEHGRRGRK